MPEVRSTDAMITRIDDVLLAMNRYRRGDLVVIVAGTPPGTVGSTNAITSIGSANGTTEFLFAGDGGAGVGRVAGGLDRVPGPVVRLILRGGR